MSLQSKSVRFSMDYHDELKKIKKINEKVSKAIVEHSLKPVVNNFDNTINLDNQLTKGNQCDELVVDNQTNKINLMTIKNNHKEPFNLEYGQFIRTTKYPKNMKLDSEALCITKLRLIKVNELDIDSKQFTGLDEIEEWPLTTLIPSNLTSDAIKQIKVGLAHGRLYNMGLLQLKVIFNQLTIVSWKNSDKLGYYQLVRCPLCPEESTVSSMYTHLERFHTSSLVVCVDCYQSIVSYENMMIHRRQCKQVLNKIKEEQPSIYEPDNEPPNKDYVEVQWRDCWRSKVDYFLNNCRLYEIVDDHVDFSTDESESEDETFKPSFSGNKLNIEWNCDLYYGLSNNPIINDLNAESKMNQN